MDVSSFVACDPKVSGVPVNPGSSSSTQTDASTDFRSVLQVLVKDPDFGHYEFHDAPMDLSYPFSVRVACGESVLNSMLVEKPDRLMEIPQFLEYADRPSLLYSDAEEIPRSLVKFAGDRDLPMLLLHPNISANDLEIVTSNFRHKMIIVKSSAATSSLSSKATLVDFTKNFQRHSNLSGDSLIRWLERDHAKAQDMEISGNVALVFILILSVSRLLPVFRWSKIFIHRLLVSGTSLALIFVNFGRQAGGGCSCCGGCSLAGGCR